MCKAIDKNSVCCLPTYPEVGLFGLLFQSYWRKYVHEVLVNRLGGLSLSRKSMVRLTDRPDMTLDVCRGRKTTTQQQRHKNNNNSYFRI